jgi:hypothetical protein
LLDALSRFELQHVDEALKLAGDVERRFAELEQIPTICPLPAQGAIEISAIMIEAVSLGRCSPAG